ncbi:MAG: UDP-N-acetylmuramoyl-L-alanine--D-glutamate ligase [Candidatus Marinimicrobia bacterium]|nr:UDP-N-acetylmuramoyl-L-alanine--D-glutamate ligase [Candidatus Neomarinimicrobiota bacterium]
MIKLKKYNRENIIDKRITVIGLGISGKAASILANQLGAIVYASDSNSSEEIVSNAMELMHDHHIATETGIHTNKIYNSDLWIISPGVSAKSIIIKEAFNHNIPIVSEIEFASWFTKFPIIGITGSNGKTTTTYILNQMFKASQSVGVIGGNIGIPFSECILKEILQPSKNLVYLLEISSFQLEFISSFRPYLSIYTNISEDHLDRHYSMKEYVKMKLRLLENCKKNNTVVFNEDDDTLKSIFHNSLLKKSTFGIKSSNHTFYLKNDAIYHSVSDKKIIKIKDIKLKGKHNLLNFLAAATCADIYGVKIEDIKNVFKTFKGIPHRIEYVTTIMGVEYINDSKATNINSVIVAIKTYNKPIILLLGGVNKGIDFGLLIPHIKCSSIKTILAYGEAGEQIKSALGDAVRLFIVNDLNSAVKNAHSIAQPGDVVLLSPGCASFDQFKNFEDRGDFFKSKVKALS